MEYQEVRDKGFSISAIVACPCCSNYEYIGRIGGDMMCTSKESPYYKPEEKGYPTFLDFKQELAGCSQFVHNGKKLPAERFKSVPADSILRSLPLESIVEGISCNLDVSPYISTQDMVEAGEDNWKYAENLLEQVKNGKSSAELHATYPLLLFFENKLVAVDPKYKYIVKVYFKGKA